jgi:mannose-6-phosphate isomerase-like protein (cupin superfamily)
MVGRVTAPIVHQPGEGEGADLGFVHFAIKAGTEDTQGAYSFVEASGNVFATPHVHDDREEAFFVLEGKVTFLAGEKTVDGSPGSFVLVPRKTMHGFRAEGEARLVIIHSPGGFERFFRESAAALARGEFDKGFRDRLAAELGMTYHDDVTF